MKNQQEVSRFLQASQGAPSTSSFLQASQQRPLEEEGGFGNVVQTLFSPLAAPFSAEARQRLLAAGAGTLGGAILSPTRALLQLPGLFTSQEIATDKAADFVERVRVGLLSTAEENALAMGMSEKEIADAYAVGNFIGLIAPVTASVKVASLITRMPVEVTKILTRGNLVNDMTAGAMFGAMLEPGDTIDERTRNLLRESAMFGVGRIMLAGIALPLKGYRNQRAIKASRDRDVSKLISDMENGRPFEVKTENEAISLGRLLSEEELVASSAAAQDLAKNVQDERALLHAIVQSSQTSAGIVRGLGRDFTSVSSMIDKFKLQFPKLKFTAVRATDEEGYSVYFGTKGLSNKQAAELKQHGRFTGQQIEKNGALYELVDPKIDAKGKFSVKTSDGTLTRIEAKGITDNPYIREELEDTLLMDDLFESFRQSVVNNWSKVAQGTSGGVSEEALIRQIREGRIKLTDSHRRAFDVSGAITYPEELAFSASGPTATVSMKDALAQVLKTGTEKAGILTEGGTPITFEDMVEAWAKNANIPENAPDFITMKAHFAQRMREWMWSQVPAQERQVFDNIRNEFLRMAEAGDLPFATIAHNKGFTAETLDAGRVSLKDLRTGMQISFGSEQRARDFLTQIIRNDMKSLGDPFNMGSGGLAAMQKGFNITDDGIFNMDGTIPSATDFIEDLPASSGIQNVRDLLQRIEGSVGIPLFSTVFDGLDRSLTRFNQQLEPWAHRVGDIWKDLSVKEAVQVGRLWAEVDGSQLSLDQAVRLFKDRGLSTKQIKAFLDSKKMFDTLFRLSGIQNERYVNLYYSRIIPFAEKNNWQVDLERIFGVNNIPPEFVPFMMESRTGDLAIRELNPAIVMHKYVRTLFFNQEVAPLYERARALVRAETTPRFKHLSVAQREAIETAARRRFDDEEIILSEPIRQTLSDYLNVVRGKPTTSQKKFTGWAQRFFKMLGMEVEERAVEEMANIHLAMQYGAAMAFRPVQVARNLTQTLWTGYTRLGGKHYNAALKATQNVEGMAEAMAAGAIRETEAGLPFGDDAFRALLDRVAVRGTGPMSKALAAALTQGLRLGNVGRDIARKGLTFYSTSDAVERSTMYHWQKLFTAEKLDLYEAGKLSWEKFIDEGLPLFHDVTKQTFTRLYNKLGREHALRWIGKQGADEANFIYGAGAQPSWMQSAVGRVFGMFGTWPMWALELYWRRTRNATPAQFAAFHVRTLALVGAFSNMALQSGYDMWSWIAPASLGYGGGPVIDNLVQMKRAVDAPMDQKADALRTLGAQVGRLALPGQVAYRDFTDALSTEDPAQMAMRIMLGRPDDTGGHFALDVMYDPKNTGFQLATPQGQAAYRSLQGFQYPKIPLLDELP